MENRCNRKSPCMDGHAGGFVFEYSESRLEILKLASTCPEAQFRDWAHDVADNPTYSGWSGVMMQISGKLR